MTFLWRSRRLIPGLNDLREAEHARQTFEVLDSGISMRERLCGAVEKGVRRLSAICKLTTIDLLPVITAHQPEEGFIDRLHHIRFHMRRANQGQESLFLLEYWILEVPTKQLLRVKADAVEHLLRRFILHLDRKARPQFFGIMFRLRVRVPFDIRTFAMDVVLDVLEEVVDDILDGPSMVHGNLGHTPVNVEQDPRFGMRGRRDA
mmetsp:Transcript_116033/g.300825  ORF Transcript_116033/g.300825 Transcript_116033/m.300825 type:complete len:205 (-) Transcript_116033:1602-2216(-)